MTQPASQPLTMKPTKELIEKLNCAVDAGLCAGLGIPEPGKMCVMAALNYAFGAEHSDTHECVGTHVREFNIRLNDQKWSSNEKRAAGMKRLLVASVGSSDINQSYFAKRMAKKTIRLIVPTALRAAAKLNPKHAEQLESAAVKCEREGSPESAREARAYAAAAYAAYAAYAASAAADAADAAADSAADAADAADSAADAAAYAAAAYAAYAVYAADSAADAAGKRDEILALSASLAVEVLIEMKSPGCEFLNLCE